MSSPPKVVKSIQVTAFSSQAALYSFLRHTDSANALALLFMAVRFILTLFSQPKSVTKVLGGVLWLLQDFYLIHSLDFFQTYLGESCYKIIKTDKIVILVEVLNNS